MPTLKELTGTCGMLPVPNMEPWPKCAHQHFNLDTGYLHLMGGLTGGEDGVRPIPKRQLEGSESFQAGHICGSASQLVSPVGEDSGMYITFVGTFVWRDHKDMDRVRKTIHEGSIPQRKETGDRTLGGEVVVGHLV